MFDRIFARLGGRSLNEIPGLVAKNARHALAAFRADERARRAADRAFDRRWGTDTSRTVSVRDLGVARARATHCRRYEASTEAMLRDPIARLAVDPATYDFIDYGAGKGRMVMLAMQMRFRSITGIEISDQLCAIARTNIARFAMRHPHVPQGRIIGADATAFMPTGERILAYFYNPFDATILDVVRQRLEDALRHGTRSVRVVYANPEHLAVFEGRPGWAVGHVAPGLATVTADARDFEGSADHHRLQVHELV